MPAVAPRTMGISKEGKKSTIAKQIDHKLDGCISTSRLDLARLIYTETRTVPRLHLRLGAAIRTE
jgi:hypothetical protein